MVTPSQRIWAGPDDGPAGGPVLRARTPMTLRTAGERVGAGLPLRDAVADFLDDLRFAGGPDDVAARIAEGPDPVAPQPDAYLGALAEHVAAARGLPVPRWAVEPHRFLDHFWWPSRTVGLRARAVVESPAAFRRRGIFIGRTTLTRI